MTSMVGSRTMAGSSLASLLLHAGAALLIPALAWLPANMPPVETVSFVRIPHILIERRTAPQPQPRSVAREQRPVPLLSLPTHVELAHLDRQRRAPPRPAVARQVSAAPVVAEAQQIGNGLAKGQPAPQTSTSPQIREVASVGNRDVGGYLPFGAEQPDPVLDPGVRKQLAALGVHVTLVVTVDEDGKTKDVAFEPPVDSQLQKQIESLLSDASWDPAVCGGGIACEGHATIRL
ncbi:MAG: hypothetical protein JO092_08450 [Candidatus Eremiobacteraeota bacterium]|nr:hypothetical protein [Candidatus Eremiobacteraeota bacterium]